MLAADADVVDVEEEVGVSPHYSLFVNEWHPPLGLQVDDSILWVLELLQDLHLHLSLLILGHHYI